MQAQDDLLTSELRTQPSSLCHGPGKQYRMKNCAAKFHQLAEARQRPQDRSPERRDTTLQTSSKAYHEGRGEKTNGSAAIGLSRISKEGADVSLFFAILDKLT